MNLRSHREDEPVVRLSGVDVTLGTARQPVPVLADLDLSLSRGQVVALLGPNGAGKTTTIRVLTTQLRPDRGQVTVAGVDALRDPAEVRRRIGLAGQQVALDRRQTGRENLTMLARLAGYGRSAARERAAEMLADFNLEDAADRRVETYSGGMGRRLDLAAALITRPEVLFLDEPTTGLDPRSRLALWQVIRRVVAEGSSLFLTTQYLEEADRLADRIALLDGGRVVADGTPTELKGQVGQARLEFTLASRSDAVLVARALGTAPPDDTTDVLTVALPTDGTVDHVRSVLTRVEGTGTTPLDWAMHEPSLDDVFLTLTGRPTHAAAPADEDHPDLSSEELAS